MSWRDQAACKDRTDINWFPDGDQRGAAARANLERARAVCDGCSVAAQCLANALDDPYTAGIWGGTTEADRRGKWVRPVVARCGTDAGYYAHLRRWRTVPCDACRDAHASAHRDRRLRLVFAR